MQPLVPPVYFLGIDGGGSRCRARLRDGSGHVLGEAEGGSANIYLAFDAALATVQSTIEACLEAASLGPAARPSTALGIGLAGVSTPSIGERVAGAIAGFAQVAVAHDGSIACRGAHGGRDGGVVIAGTGSAALLRRDGREASFGGRGFLLGDDGSGAVIGRDIWRKALLAHDGLGPRSPLLDALMNQHGDDPVAVITWGRAAPSHAFAAYASQVLAAARDGDEGALPVATAAGAAIGNLVEGLHRRGAPRIALVGGLGPSLLPFLPTGARARLSPPLNDALDGALLMAGAPLRAARDA